MIIYLLQARSIDPFISNNLLFQIQIINGFINTHAVLACLYACLLFSIFCKKRNWSVGGGREEVGQRGEAEANALSSHLETHYALPSI